MIVESSFICGYECHFKGHSIYFLEGGYTHVEIPGPTGKFSLYIIITKSMWYQKAYKCDLI